jgi:AraC family transcriptional regulator
MEMLHPGIVMLSEKKLVGKQIRMSFSDNKTVELWKSFMPRRKEIINSTGSELYSIEMYEPGFFTNFDPQREFYKCAAVEVTDFDFIPDGMEKILFPAGLYAVFPYKGPASLAAKTYEYIFRAWLPDSDYLVDDRPHFAVMGERYKYEGPDSEEEIWIPTKMKT